MEKDIVALVEGGHDVERATAILNVCGYGDVGKGRTFVLRDPGVRVLIAVCIPFCASQACIEGSLEAIESVVSELDTFVS